MRVHNVSMHILRIHLFFLAPLHRSLYLLCICIFVLNGCASTAPVTTEDYGRENITIRTQQLPDEARWRRATQMRGLGEIKPLMPAFDNQGLLMARWTRSTEPDAPTRVIAAHGQGSDQHPQCKHFDFGQYLEPRAKDQRRRQHFTVWTNSQLERSNV